MPPERLSFADALGAFAPGQHLRAVLILTYCFDGRWFEEAVAPELFERPVITTLLLRDRHALISEAPSVRYHRADAAYSRKVFHPKLALFIAEDQVRAIVGSANMTRGGFERNLELGSVFDLSAESGSRSFFNALFGYVNGPLRRETDGSGLRALDDIAVALREVIDKSPAEREPSPHILLHNYERPLWDQLLAKLPHRVLRRAAVVSPFFEPDTAVGHAEDPPGQAGDDSIFKRLFSDFKFETNGEEDTVTVFFQEDSGATALPVTKLKTWKRMLHLQARLATSDDARRLHGKLIVLEGSGKNGRDPFLIALHGSPNFTSAALLKTPPDGNAELAILTRLPTRGGGVNKILTTLGLGELFGPVSDWGSLHTKTPTIPPTRYLAAAFVLTDATLQVAGQVLVVSIRNLPPDAVRFRLSAQVEGVWLQLAEGPWGNSDTMSIPVSTLLTADPKTKLHTLSASRVRMEILSRDGTTLACDEAPLNVDCPHQFCGMAMAGPLFLTIDQRIAQAGAGVPMTYREQQKWLEQLRQREGSAVMAVSDHQADLDKFFRNLNTGLKGLRRRLDESPHSEFTLRNSLRQLSGWCSEAVAPDGKVATDECRLFLLDRLAGEMLTTLNRAMEKTPAASRLSAAAGELGLSASLESALSWLSEVALADTDAYRRRTRKRFGEVRQTLDQLGRQH
jgi:hypothetical protein